MLHTTWKDFTEEDSQREFRWSYDCATDSAVTPSFFIHGREFEEGIVGLAYSPAYDGESCDEINAKLDQNLAHAESVLLAAGAKTVILGQYSRSVGPTPFPKPGQPPYFGFFDGWIIGATT